MRQRSLSSGFDKHHKQTRKERFLSEVDQVLPWKPLVKAVEPYYPNPQGAGRRPISSERRRLAPELRVLIDFLVAHMGVSGRGLNLPVIC